MLDGIDFSFVRIGERIASQRNAFAHGNLSKSFNEDTLVYIGFLKNNRLRHAAKNHRARRQRNKQRH